MLPGSVYVSWKWLWFSPVFRKSLARQEYLGHSLYNVVDEFKYSVD